MHAVADRLLGHLLFESFFVHSPRETFEYSSCAGYVEGVYTSLRDGTLRRVAETGIEETAIAAADMPGILGEILYADPVLHLEAADVHRRFAGDAGHDHVRS